MAQSDSASNAAQQDLIFGIARFVARARREDELHRAFLDLVEPCRAEEGCVRYDVFTSRAQPALLMIVEAWTDQSCLDRHFVAPHIQAFMAKSDELLAEPLTVTWSRMLSKPSES